MAAEGLERQEEGHKWPEILISVKVLEVTGVSVKLTPPYLPLSSSLGRELCNGVLTWPLSFMSQSGDDRFQRWSPPTCRWAVYLLKHISRILYISTFQKGAQLAARARGLVSLADSRKPLKSGVRSARGAQAAAPRPTCCFTSCVWCFELFTLGSCPRRKTEQPRSAVEYAETWTRWGDFTSSVGRLQGSLSDLYQITLKMHVCIKLHSRGDIDSFYFFSCVCAWSRWI